MNKLGVAGSNLFPLHQSPALRDLPLSSVTSAVPCRRAGCCAVHHRRHPRHGARHAVGAARARRQRGEWLVAGMVGWAVQISSCIWLEGTLRGHLLVLQAQRGSSPSVRCRHICSLGCPHDCLHRSAQLRAPPNRTALQPHPTLAHPTPPFLSLRCWPTWSWCACLLWATGAAGSTACCVRLDAPTDAKSVARLLRLRSAQCMLTVSKCCLSKLACRCAWPCHAASSPFRRWAVGRRLPAGIWRARL